MASKTTSTANLGRPKVETQSVQAAQVQAASRRAFSRTSDEGPAPEFVNNVEFTSLGMDVFMDVGTVSPEAIRDAMEVKPSGKLPTVKFNVDCRFGMSLQTAAIMHQRLTALLQASAAQAATQATAEITAGAEAQKAESQKGV